MVAGGPGSPGVLEGPVFRVSGPTMSTRAQGGKPAFLSPITVLKFVQVKKTPGNHATFFVPNILS